MYACQVTNSYRAGECDELSRLHSLTLQSAPLENRLKLLSRPSYQLHAATSRHSPPPLTGQHLMTYAAESEEVQSHTTPVHQSKHPEHTPLTLPMAPHLAYMLTSELESWRRIGRRRAPPLLRTASACTALPSRHSAHRRVREPFGLDAVGAARALEGL
jgi:hypothetical protein